MGIFIPVKNKMIPATAGIQTLSFICKATNSCLHMRFVVYLLTTISIATVASCSHKGVESKPQSIKLSRDSVAWALGYRFYVAEAYRYVGTDSTNLFDLDTTLKIYQRVAYLYFTLGSGGFVNAWFGQPIPNTEIPGPALTFGMNIRVDQPTGLTVEWDDQRSTLIVKSVSRSSYFPIVVPGKSAYLEASSFKIHRTLAEARDAAVKGSMTFIYDDVDPKLGKVMYKIKLKPMYEYYRPPLQQEYAKFAVF